MGEKKYYIVDKETGQIVGESNRRQPGKRILAFIVLYLLSLVTRFVTYQYIHFLSWILGKIYGLSKLAYYIVIFFGGSTSIGLLIWFFSFGANAMYDLSEKIIHSRNGARYMFLGIFISVFYLISLITMIAGISSDTSAFQYVWHIIIIIFFVVFAFYGRGRTRDG